MRKSETRSIVGTIAVAAAGLIAAASLGVIGAVLTASEAFPRELAATAPIPQPRPPEQPEVFKVPIELTCLPFKMAEAELHKLGRFNIGGGISSKELVTLFYATPDMREFTIMTLDASGVACIVISGNYLDFKRIERRAA